MKQLFCLLSACLFKEGQGQQTVIQYLSGTDKDHTVNWDFMVNNGRNANRWSTIAVPSCWETQGFGTYSYYQDVKDADEKGMYRYNFTVAPQHKGKKVFIVFEAAMTEADVKVNGKPAGAVHQGGFYEFNYDVTDLLKFGASNLLEVTVSKKSANNSVNRAERQADFWLFGGLFRPVYLEIVPPTFIRRVAIDARADGNFSIQVFGNASANQTVEAQVYDLAGKPLDEAFRLAAADSVLHHRFTGIKRWNPEEPDLYNVVVSIKEGAKVLHTLTQRFGFRTAELRPNDGMYVNGTKVIFKGVCRHSEWPESGRTLSRAVHLLDIKTMKGMNMNAVRMSHYPPDKEFLDLCDSLGLFVLDELTGWQKAYDTATAKRLVKELIVRDVNHPSIVLWDNGNEGGWNRGVDDDYALYDPQKRHVIHPWERFSGTNTKHYPDYKYVQNEVANAKEVFFPTEFMHGLFDGGHGAGLDDFWNLMMRHPHTAGGFLWSLHDEGVVRRDRHDSIDVAGNQAPDGIVGPHREKEGSYYTIRELWSPVYIETQDVAENFTGKIGVENRYLYTDLDKIKFEWALVTFPSPQEKSTRAKPVQKGVAALSSVPPGGKGTLTVPLPANLFGGAFYLTAFDPKGDTVCTWSWPVASNQKAVRPPWTVAEESPPVLKENADVLVVSCNGIRYTLGKTTGTLQQVASGEKIISLNGPALAGSKAQAASVKHYTLGDSVIVEASCRNDSLKLKWTFSSGQNVRLDYGYLMQDSADFAGITFNYPEEKLTGMKWLGRGPYRVWKNRLKGQQLGVWEKAYNNTVTGENWSYPEFKGWHSEVRWVQIRNTEKNFVVYTAGANTYLQLLKPQRPKAAPNNYTWPPFPDGSIGFMHGISAIGTKFQKAEAMGPQSQRNLRQGNRPLAGTLFFDFR